MKLVKESLLEFYKPKSIKDAARIGTLYRIQDEMKEEGKEYSGLDSALMWSIINNKIKYTEYLLKAGANIDDNNNFGFLYACENGYIEIVKLLLDSGVDIHAENDYAIKWAIKNNQYDLVDLLKKYM